MKSNVFHHEIYIIEGLHGLHVDGVYSRSCETFSWPDIKPWRLCLMGNVSTAFVGAKLNDNSGCSS